MDSSFFRRSVFRAVMVANTFRPRRVPTAAFLPSFLTSWMANEMPLQVMAWNGATTALQIRKGALATPKGRVAVGLNLAAIGGLGALYLRNRRSIEAIDDAVRELGIQPEPAAAPISIGSRAAAPMAFRRKGVAVTRHVQYGEAIGTPLHLDVFAPGVPPLPGESRPALVQIHGGGWVVGDKREQGLPLLNHMAANGWVGFNVNYRLGPKHHYPDHLVDVKTAITWIRERADQYGIDPDRIAVTGGSAGGHLAALVGLTAGDPDFQPGFENADTSVIASVPFYAPFDLTDSAGHHGPEFVRFLERYVLGGRFDDHPERFISYSPYERIHADAPPFFVLHGDLDTLVPVADARRFVARLRAVSRAPVAYAEIPGAQHAFEVFHGPRTNQAIESVRVFLDHVAAGQIGASAASRDLVEVG